MKRHIQKTGVRRFFGQDLVELQAEPLKALDAFFAAYGACIIEGCAITEADGGTFNVAPGLVALECTDPESGVVAVRTMPFVGTEGVAMPLYLTAQWQVIERVYDDGKVKPIGYDLSAVASGIAPEAPHLLLTAAGGHRFVDAVQDGTHRFISDAERTKWNGVLQQAKEYAGLQAEAAKRSAIEHTDAAAAAIRDEQAIADAAGLRSAKEYADRIVAALVDNSPEALNTLQELAAALGGDPEFATTVMKAIGERATMTQVNAALAGKADTNHGHQSVPRLQWYKTDGSGIENNCWLAARRSNPLDGSTRIYLREGEERWHNQVEVYKADTVPWGGVSDKQNATTTQPGLMSDGDKQKLDGTESVSAAEKTAWNNKFHYARMEGVNLNTLITSGTYVIPSGASNAPSGSGEVRLMVLGGGPDPRVMQLANAGTDQELYFRMRYDWANWSSWHQIHHSGNYPKIIRGSVAANGTNGGGNAYGVGGVYGEDAVVRVTHNLNTTAYSAQATAVSNTNSVHTDNVVTVWRKGTNFTDFVVTNGSDPGRELCAFDFMIIPY